MGITATTKIITIIGDPVEHSLSPQMHNRAYRALGIDSEFVFIASRVTKEHLADAMRGARALGIAGITVTVPHKTEIMQYLDDIDVTAQKIGAVNTVINHDGKLSGYNTDWTGIAEPLKMVITLKGKRVVILGAGGAARATIFACQYLGGKVTILNRTGQRAQQLAENVACAFGSLNDTEQIRNADVIINTTSVGLKSDKSPITKEDMQKGQIVFDVVYHPYETQLLKDAKEKGAITIHGTEMLLHQGLEQFKLFTGRTADEQVMRNAIMENISLSS